MESLELLQDGKLITESDLKNLLFYLGGFDSQLSIELQQVVDTVEPYKQLDVVYHARKSAAARNKSLLIVIC